MQIVIAPRDTYHLNVEQFVSPYDPCDHSGSMALRVHLGDSIDLVFRSVDCATKLAHAILNAAEGSGAWLSVTLPPITSLLATCRQSAQIESQEPNCPPGENRATM